MILKTEDIIPIIPQNRGNLTAPSRLSKHGGPTTADRHTFNLGGSETRLSSYKMMYTEKWCVCVCVKTHTTTTKKKFHL